MNQMDKDFFNNTIYVICYNFHPFNDECLYCKKFKFDARTFDTRIMRNQNRLLIKNTKFHILFKNYGILL